MKITSKTKGIIDEGYRYKFDGDIVTEEDLTIELDKGLYVTGYIKSDGYITADWYITAGRFIRAGWYITAGGFIRAGGSIKADGYITADWYIKADGSIEAGWYITAGEGIVSSLHITCKELDVGKRIFAGVCNWRDIEDKDKTITCTELVNGEVCYGILNETGEGHTITIDGKDIEISNESFNNLREQLREE